MADRKTKARNGYQDAADMAITGRYRGPSSSSTIQPAGTDEVILASLEEFKEENNDTLRKLFNTVREFRDKCLEGQRTIIFKEDKVLEALVRLKRPVYDDVEFERTQAVSHLRMALFQEETMAAEAGRRKLREVRMIIFAVGVVLVAVLFAFRWSLADFF